MWAMMLFYAADNDLIANAIQTVHITSLLDILQTADITSHQVTQYRKYTLGRHRHLTVQTEYVTQLLAHSKSQH